MVQLFSFPKCADRSLPGKAAVEFHFQAETEESSNEDDTAENSHADRRRPDGNGLHDVSGNQHFQAKQDRATDVLAITGKAVRAIAVFQISPGSDQQTDDDEHDARNIDCGAQSLDECGVIHAC